MENRLESTPGEGAAPSPLHLARRAARHWKMVAAILVVGLVATVMAARSTDQIYRSEAVLLYRQPVPLEVELPADPSHLAPTRAALRAWLTEVGIDPDQTLKVLIAVGEALANAIEHGHRDHAEGTVSLRVIAVADRVHVTVADTGSWKTPVAAAHRGRGIALMRALMHDVTIEQLANGTAVHMHAKIA